MRVMYYSVTFWLLNFCFISVFCNQLLTNDTLEEDLLLQREYKEMDNNLKSLINQGYKFMLPKLLEASESMNLSTSCVANYLSIGLGVRKLKLWSMQFLDAVGKPNEGILLYNPQMFGNYDECLSATSEKKNGKVDFHGKYCMVNYQLLLPDPEKAPEHILLRRTYLNTRNISELLQDLLVRFQEGYRYKYYYGLCIPSGCSLTDAEKMFKYLGDRIYVKFTVEHCQVMEDTSYMTTRKLVIICIIAFFGLLGIISSTIEYYSRLKDVKFTGMGARVLQCFSITENFSKLINTKTETELISCINGIRVLSTFYVILQHKYLVIQYMNLTSNYIPNIVEYIPTLFNQIIYNGMMVIEVFIFISGFLNSYMRVKLAKKGKAQSWGMILIHRLWRIYPGYIITILLLYLLTPRGPFSVYYIKHFIEDCNGEWWKNLLFINNFYPKSKCLEHTWYIACDTQLFLMSLITVPMLIKKPKKGILLHIAVIFCGFLSSALWNYLMQTAPTFLFDLRIPGGKEEFRLPYLSFSNRIATYFLGILMGYFMSVKKNIKIPKVYQICGWIISSFIFTSMLFMTYRWNSGTQYTALESLLYFTFSKSLYGASIGWIIFTCITGHGGVINYILSLKIWVPLSRLSFTTYLVSLVVQLFYLANLRVVMDTQLMSWIWDYFGDVCISTLLALAVSILIESPMIALEKLVFRGAKKVKKNDNLEIEAVTRNDFQGKVPS